jgi:hypothetical protein
MQDNPHITLKMPNGTILEIEYYEGGKKEDNRIWLGGSHGLRLQKFSDRSIIVISPIKAKEEVVFITGKVKA